MISIDRSGKHLFIEESELLAGGAYISLHDRSATVGIQIPAGTRLEAAKELAGPKALVLVLPEIEDQIVTNHMRFGDRLAASEEYHLKQLAIVREARRRLAEQPKRDPEQMKRLTEVLVGAVLGDPADQNVVARLYDDGLRVNA